MAVCILVFGLAALYPPFQILWTRGGDVLHMKPSGLAFLSGMVALGLVLVLVALDSILQKSVVELTHHYLTISTRGLIRNSLKEWRREDVRDVRVEFAPIEVNERRLRHLVVESDQGAQGYFLNREKDELNWLAYELRRALKLETRSQDRS